MQATSNLAPRAASLAAAAAWAATYAASLAGTQYTLGGESGYTVRRVMRADVCCRPANVRMANALAGGLDGFSSGISSQ